MGVLFDKQTVLLRIFAKKITLKMENSPMHKYNYNNEKLDNYSTRNILNQDTHTYWDTVLLNNNNFYKVTTWRAHLRRKQHTKFAQNHHKKNS